MTSDDDTELTLEMLPGPSVSAVMTLCSPEPDQAWSLAEAESQTTAASTGCLPSSVSENVIHTVDTLSLSRSATQSHWL